MLIFKKRIFLKSILMLTVLSGMSASVFAESGPFSMKPAYVGIDLGAGGMFVGDNDLNSTPIYLRPYNIITVQSGGGSYVYRLFGGYLFPMNDKFQFGPEISYTSYSNKTTTFTGETFGFGVPVNEVDTYSGHTVELLANATYHNSPIVYMFAKMGLAFITQTLNYDVTSNASNFNSSTSNVNHGTLPALHLGMGFQLAENFGLELSAFGFLGGTNPSTENYSTATTQANQIASVWGLLIGFRGSF